VAQPRVSTCPPEGRRGGGGGAIAHPTSAKVGLWICRNLMSLGEMSGEGVRVTAADCVCIGYLSIGALGGDPPVSTLPSNPGYATVKLYSLLLW